MPVRPPSLQSVAAFEAAARHQSFAKAADELNLTHGAISHAIRKLEARLGQTLFERRGRGVALTADGRSLAARVRLSLNLLGDAFAPAANDRQRLRVSLMPSVASRILIPRLAELQAALPGLELDLRCSSALADLAGGEADVAVRFGPGGWAGVQALALADERLVPVASPDFRGGRPPRSVEDLLDCPVIRHPESAWRLWLDPLGIDEARLPTGLAVDDAGAVLDAAAAGCGVALARVRLAEPDLAAGRLVRLFEREVSAEYGYWCVWNGGSPKRRLIEAFAERLRALMA
ncbi:LysR substrate-binding domain-containing protein [Caulobacter sp. 17J65-9]|uniref:LysR substrate-binding domain-containing protein n=1 Tax=Caulobacter sp. 17J65-9 TaxID=2709382 RepID=UPI0013C7E717|nr:LysR substrate-binding domain-containing protein [Caulobacter sp. 17J65-9]NEX94761.1 LysR family transcriptional regulator [Caulobacter sp. 17J65-9]